MRDQIQGDHLRESKKHRAMAYEPYLSVSYVPC
jgi:hypothetical protein